MDGRLLAQPSTERRPFSVEILTRTPEFHRDLKIARGLGLTTDAFYRLPEGEQALHVAADSIENATCSSCGNPLDECRDATKVWYPQKTVCYSTMERSAAVARYADLHEDAPYHDGTFTNWGAERSAATPYHFGEGVSIFASTTDLGLGGDFLGRLSSEDEEDPGAGSNQPGA